MERRRLPSEWSDFNSTAKDCNHLGLLFVAANMFQGSRAREPRDSDRQGVPTAGISFLAKKTSQLRPHIKSTQAERMLMRVCISSGKTTNK